MVKTNTNTYKEPVVSIHGNGKHGINPHSKFPFKSRLSFAKLIAHWRTYLESDDIAKRTLAETLFEELEEVPQFYEPIEDHKILKLFPDIVNIMLSGLLPVSRRESQLGMVSEPFNFDGFFRTPSFEVLHQKKEAGLVLSKEPEFLESFMIIRPSVEILNQFYGQSIELDPPTIFTVQSADNELERHYKSELDLSFMEVKAIKPLKKLSPAQINELLHNIRDLSLWQKYIPPDHFEFHGIVALNLVDVTDEEALSRLKYILLEKDAVVNKKMLKNIQQQLRTIFRLPELQVGITAVDCSRRHSMIYPNHLKNSFLSDTELNLLDEKFNGSLYCRMCTTEEAILVEDLTKEAYKTTLEEYLLEKGIKNVLISPLKDNHGKIIGILELGSPNICEINSVAALRLSEMLPLFTIAVERKREEVQNQIESVIREQYTAVHPSVTWKFTETAAKLIEDREREGISAKIDPIVFHDVYPLYGQVDIVSSSKFRNDSIQADLLENLERADRIAHLGYHQLKYPLLDNLCLKIRQCIKSIREEIDSSHEARIIEFFHTEVHPFFEQIQKKDPQLRKHIQNYYDTLDPDLAILYKERKAYEQSVTMINDMLSATIDGYQKEAQEMFPHYFEKYKTDGVEYNMYIGESLLQKEEFHEIHLHNLRLWQLTTMCEITRKVANLKEKLPVPLTTAQMILVHNSPLTIRFRMDEKQFDVDGAYNVRYEILKKRVDKSLINGTQERLTVSGKIAIIYTQDKEEREYDSYLEYLVEKGEIEPDIERLPLAPVQGVSGLKALRITVRNPEDLDEIDEETCLEV